MVLSIKAPTVGVEQQWQQMSLLKQQFICKCKVWTSPYHQQVVAAACRGVPSSVLNVFCPRDTNPSKAQQCSLIVASVLRCQKEH